MSTRNYPPQEIINPPIMEKKNFEHIILWISINQSSLSKTMKLLIKNGVLRKDEENKEYRITQSGKSKYSRMLKSYDLDRQTILEEETRRIEGKY